MEVAIVRDWQNKEAIATLGLKEQGKGAVVSDPGALRDIWALKNPMQKKEGGEEVPCSLSPSIAHSSASASHWPSPTGKGKRERLYGNHSSVAQGRKRGAEDGKEPAHGLTVTTKSIGIPQPLLTIASPSS